jgi:hypothetical protein
LIIHGNTTKYSAHVVFQFGSLNIPFDQRILLVGSLNILQEAVNMSLENLKSYPFVKEALEKGTIKLLGAHYDFIHGKSETWEH